MRPAKEVHYTKKMNLDHILTFSFSNLFKQFSAYSQWVLLSLIIVVINLIPVGIVLMGIDFGGSIPVYAAPEEIFNNVNVGLIGLASIFFIIAILIDIFFAFYSSVWFYRVGLDGYDGVKRSFGERFKLGFRELPKVAAASILIALIVLAFMIPYIAVDFVSEATGSMFWAGLGVLLYVIYMVAAYTISIRLSCTISLIMDGEQGVIEAIKTSWAMTKGRSWRILGYMLLIGLLGGLLIVGLMIPAIILWVVTAVADFTPALLGITIIFSILSYMIIIGIQMGITTNMPVAIYKRLCIEHEEELPTASEADGTTTSPSVASLDSTPKDDEIKF